MSKEDKKNNAKVNKAKRQGKSKRELGLKGKVTRKHIAIRVVQEKFGLKFKQKENDIAEAICLGVSYHLGVPLCDGKDGKKKTPKCVCPNPELHAQLAAPNLIDPTKCSKGSSIGKDNEHKS